MPIGDDTDLLGWLWSTRFNNALGPHTIVNANLDDLSAIDSCSAAIGCALGYWASAD